MTSPYRRILRAAYATPWAIMPEKLEAILGFLELKAQGVLPGKAELEEIRAEGEMLAARAASAKSAVGAVALLPLYGTIMQRASLMNEISGGTSTQQFASQFRAALNDTNVKAIVIDVSSPGGSVAGVQELCDEIFNSRGKKPVVAVANSLMASAAYWIASSADEIIATPSAIIGSIGVFMAHEDESKAMEASGVKTTLISAGKFKTEGNEYEPLTDSARAAMQEMVDGMYDSFVKGVARGRKTTQTAVRDGYGQGRAVLADKAIKLGLADRIATLDEVLAGFGVSRAAGGRAEDNTDVTASALERERRQRQLDLAGA